MARWPQLVIVVALLGATAAAFVYTQHLKLEKSPITGTRVDKVFSPVCECVRDVAVISFVLRRAETVSLEIIDADGKPVRTVVDERHESKGRVSYTWDGRDDDGRIVADARYRPRVELERNGRTIVLPNPIRVDTTAPTIEVARVKPRVFSPDGDGNRDSVTAAGCHGYAGADSGHSGRTPRRGGSQEGPRSAASEQVNVLHRPNRDP